MDSAICLFKMQGKLYIRKVEVLLCSLYIYIYIVLCVIYKGSEHQVPYTNDHWGLTRVLQTTAIL